MVPTVLRVVLPALSDADLSVSSVSTLKRICRECKHHLYPHANDILASSQVQKNSFLLFVFKCYKGNAIKFQMKSKESQVTHDKQNE